MFGRCKSGHHRKQAYEKYRKMYGYHGRGGWRRPKYNVPVNIIEEGDHFEVWVYSLSFSKENIKISVVDGILYISGTRTIDEENTPNFALQEYPIKSFERVFDLNEKVDTENISAREEDGVLKITLPKTASAREPEKWIDIV